MRNYYEHNSLKAALFVIENQKDKMKKTCLGIRFKHVSKQ